VSAEAFATHTCQLVDNVSGPAKNDFSYPTACSIRFKFAPQPGMPAMELFWYDGGMKPRLPGEIEAVTPAIGIEGILFIGDKGMILAGYFGEDPVLFANGKHEPLLPPADAARPNPDAVERNKLWRTAFQGGAESPGSFLNLGPISDTVNLGTVALRAGQKVVFDSASAKITNADAANQYLVREYRKGWEL
jgi:hypothetical protein